MKKLKNYLFPIFKEIYLKAEKVKEWESMDLCAPGDAIGSAAWRCKKFHYHCHDCLVDYSLHKVEYESFKSFLELCNPHFSIDDNRQKELKRD